MGATPYALGRQLLFFCRKETAFRSEQGNKVGGVASGDPSYQEVLAAGGTDACKATTTSMEFSVERRERTDSRSTRSSTGFITGKEEISWSCETYIEPIGGSTEPNCSPLLESVFGKAFAANKYQLSDGTGGAEGLSSVHLARGNRDIIREDVFGAWVDEWGLSFSGGDIPKMTFSGGAAGYALTAHTLTTTSATGSTALTVAEGHNLQLGSRVSIPDPDSTPVNTAQIRTVEAIDGNSITLGNISGVSANTNWASGAAVTPYFPDETPAVGAIVGGITGSLTIDSIAFPIVSFDVTLNNGIKPVNDLAFQAGADDFIPMARTVTGNISVRAKRDDIRAFTRRQRRDSDGLTFDSLPIVVNFGETTGKKCQISMPTCELNFGALDIPESDEAVLSIPYTAISSAGATEIEFKWNET